MTINVLLLNLMVRGSGCLHRSISSFIGVIGIIKAICFCISFKLLDYTVSLFGIVFGYISFNTGGIKEKHRGEIAINVLAYRFGNIDKIIKN